jgi:hypothetical protein
MNTTQTPRPSNSASMSTMTSTGGGHIQVTRVGTTPKGSSSPERPATNPQTTPSRATSQVNDQRTAVTQGTHVADLVPDPVAIAPSVPLHLTLLDPALALAADILDDLERVRIANQNRLAQLTRSTEDADGEVRGFGLDESHPDVARLAAMVDVLRRVEHDAELALGLKLRKHPLGPWVVAKEQKGVGAKQAARLLAKIGDPYVNAATGLPRTVSALWAYCGLHVLPVDQEPEEAQQRLVDGNQHPDQIVVGTQGRNVGEGGNFDHGNIDTHSRHVGVAPRRRRNEKANWSSQAKMRVYLIAESCMKQVGPSCRIDQSKPDTQDAGAGAVRRHTEDCTCSRFRVIYDQARAKYADAVHQVVCVRCGPAGKPAQPGSALSAGHQHMRAMRIVMKEILKELWREARRIHRGE